MSESYFLWVKLLLVIISGNALYYFIGALKKVSLTSVEEFNDTELVITHNGHLEEIHPDEVLTPQEAKGVNLIGRILFVTLGGSIWCILGLVVGRFAYLLQPSDLMKLLIYFLVYFFFLRIPFGIMNKMIEKAYEVKVMPDKLLFAVIMIASFLTEINYPDDIPLISSCF